MSTSTSAAAPVPSSPGSATPRAPSDDLRAHLREATHASHSALNRHPLLRGITTPDYPLADYQRVLLAYFHLYRPLEDNLRAALQRYRCAFPYQDRVKLPWLAEDLAHFGINPWRAGGKFPPPSAPALPQLDSPGSLLGALYVVEGATLGGALISRQLLRHHQLSPERGARFFHGYGDLTEVRWQEFLDFCAKLNPPRPRHQTDEKLTETDSAKRKADDAVVAACALFESVHQQLERYRPNACAAPVSS